MLGFESGRVKAGVKRFLEFGLQAKFLKNWFGQRRIGWLSRGIGIFGWFGVFVSHIHILTKPRPKIKEELGDVCIIVQP